MRLKLVLLLVLISLVVASQGKKGKGKKGSKRDRDRPQRNEREFVGDSAEEDEEPTERRGGKKNRDNRRNRHRQTDEPEDETPSNDDESRNRENERTPNSRPRGRPRLLKVDPRRHTSQQNGPIPPQPRGSRRSSEGIAHGLDVMGASEGLRRSNLIGVSQNRLSEEEKGIFLEAHNQFRSQVSPYAANMVELQWDDHLANMAQGWADECTFSHGNPDNISPFNYVGQNIWAGSGNGNSWNHFEMVQSWDDEKEYYDYNSNSCSGVCGHYTQVVWAETTHVGCALATCSPLQGLGWSPATILVCNYGEGGNYVGERPYVSGYPCSQCPSGYGRCTMTQLCSQSSAPDNVDPDEPEPQDPPQNGGIPSEENQGGNNQPPAPPDVGGNDCGGTLRETSGEIVSPNFPSPYDNNMNCEWIIRGRKKSRISIQFLFMDIEAATQCPWDYLMVSAEDLNEIKYCGNVSPAPIQSSSNIVRIEFSSDGSVVRGGFKLRYMIQEHRQQEEETCGGVITGTKGTITSPGYPEQYSHNLDCLWTIKVADKKRVRVVFKAMAIEDHDTCDYDSLTIRLGNEKVPMRLCGSEFMKGKAYISLSKEMKLHFRTDNQGSSTGFSLAWKAI